MQKLTRRNVLAGAAALPLAAGLSPAMASAPMLGAASATFNRFKLGAFEVTALLAETRVLPNPHEIFGLNVSEEEFNKVSAQANLPTDQARFFFTPTVVNTGSQVILFDTGVNADGTLAALNSAGYTADQVDCVVITHMHPDHVGGIMQNGSPTFPNARYMTGAVEFDAWKGTGNEAFDANMLPVAEKTTMLKPGADVVSGVTAMNAFGHTPGHMVYMIESEGAQLVIAADFANHYVWSLAHPDWEVRFDMDKTAAAKTRRRLLDMMATDHIPFLGYHMPWPATGFVEAHGSGFRYAATSYQLSL